MKLDILIAAKDQFATSKVQMFILRCGRDQKQQKQQAFQKKTTCPLKFNIGTKK